MVTPTLKATSNPTTTPHCNRQEGTAKSVPPSAHPGLQSSTLTATPTDYAPARARAELRIVDAQIAVEDARAELRLALGDYHGLLSAQLDELERLEVAA